MTVMWSLFNLKTTYEVTEFKPLKAKEFVCSDCLCSLLGLVAGSKLPKERFFFPFLLVDDTVVINNKETDIVVFL